MNTPATQAAEQRLQALAWLKTHYPEIVDAYWHGELGIVRAALLRLVEPLQAIHDEELLTAHNPSLQSDYEHLYLEGDPIGSDDKTMAIGRMREAQDVMEHFGCTCQPKEEEA